ncbi:Rhodanese-related sulfurtransferase [Halanaeroarchaeum sp. HSR-CO]|uniref:rhodanese-like domain-containing protein n=1 Tax=Halanaeroarchaeum sp. HSR-CO TaxID=2866382 RepID=UPI00217DFB70|nr:rhodanese-like domain-containing protein [Halanaeroarchaeum sp. HSR-CO]UWG46340.1 Rhodanese-related sulfurtransferase [Halanaeroarchaeum sp. HSR-CO]
MVEPVSPAGVRNTIDSATPVAVIDIRPSLDYVEGNIKESTWVPRAVIEDRLPDVVPNPQTPVILCDDHGERADDDARWLERLGYATVDYLDGGLAAYRAAGYDLVEAEDGVHATAFHYESKEFGEVVANAESLPKIGPKELASIAEDVTIVDVRNPPEYDRYGSIPGSINVEGVDLALFAEAVRDAEEPLVVHCAGRTRSIIGTATLRALGFDEVYELENGTMGWELEGYELAAGSERVRDRKIPADRYRDLQEKTTALLQNTSVEWLSPAELDRIEDTVESTQSVYVFDVRTDDEYSAEHHPEAISVAGGQLIQTAGSHIGVRTGEIVLISNSHVRSAITAYWLDRMGYPNVSVVRGGLSAWKEHGGAVATGRPKTSLGDEIVEQAAATISPAELIEWRATDEVEIIDVRDRAAYDDGHIAGAGWASRYELEAVLAGAEHTGRIVITCADGDVSRRAIAQSSIQGTAGDPAVELVAVRGGVAAWVEDGHPLETDVPRYLSDDREAVPKPYSQGREAMKRYLEWEENLVEG